MHLHWYLQEATPELACIFESPILLVRVFCTAQGLEPEPSTLDSNWPASLPRSVSIHKDDSVVPDLCMLLIEFERIGEY